MSASMREMQDRVAKIAEKVGWAVASAEVSAIALRCEPENGETISYALSALGALLTDIASELETVNEQLGLAPD